MKNGCVDIVLLCQLLQWYVFAHNKCFRERRLDAFKEYQSLLLRGAVAGSDLEVWIVVCDIGWEIRHTHGERVARSEGVCAGTVRVTHKEHNAVSAHALRAGSSRCSSGNLLRVAMFCNLNGLSNGCQRIDNYGSCKS